VGSKAVFQSRSVHARVAGFLFLFYIAAVALASLMAGSDQPDLVRRAWQTLRLLGGLSAIPLGFSLYVVLRPVDRDWAIAAYVWRVAEGVLNAVASAFAFAALGATTKIVAPTIMPISILCFAIGSLIFFRLIVQSRLLPLWLGLSGVVGSVCALILAATMLLVPHAPSYVGILWVPLAIAEIIGGLWMLAGKANLSRIGPTGDADS
jgi:hypothetical protein